MIKVRICAVAVFVILPLATLAQEEPAYVDISACMAMENDENRLACYNLLEAQVNAARLRESSLPVVSLPRNTRQEQDAPVIQNDAEAIESFGNEDNTQQQRQQASARILENEDGEQELLGTISLLDTRMPNQWAITLVNGQVWHQVNSKRYRLREGMEVRIYPSPFGGSFRLSAPNQNGFIQVRRIQ